MGISHPDCHSTEPYMRFLPHMAPPSILLNWILRMGRNGKKDLLDRTSLEIWRTMVLPPFLVQRPFDRKRPEKLYYSDSFILEFNFDFVFFLYPPIP